MDIMRSRNYCIIAVDNTKGIRDDVLSIAISPFKYLENESMLIITFTTFLTPTEIDDILQRKNRSYFLFEINKAYSAIHLKNKKLYDYLFKEIVEEEEEESNFLTDIINRLSERHDVSISYIDMRSDTPVSKTKDETDELSFEELESYTKEEREILLNKLLDKAPNLTNREKEVLNFLAKKDD